MKTTRKKLISKLDTIVSLLVRTRDKKCVTPSPKCTKILQCSHLIKRGKLPTRFSLENCNCQCSYHNYLHNNYPEIYTEWWLGKYGQEKYNTLIRDSQKIWKPSIAELSELLTHLTKIYNTYV
jgi:hypothetical protein